MWLLHLLAIPPNVSFPELFLSSSRVVAPANPHSRGSARPLPQWVRCWASTWKSGVGHLCIFVPRTPETRTNHIERGE